MTKLIKYELKSIILSKKYFYINLLLIISVLKDLNTLLGSWNLHAAVSPWTYADFIVRQNSLLITFIVLLGLNVFSNNENRVKNIMFFNYIFRKRLLFFKTNKYIHINMYFNNYINSFKFYMVCILFKIL